jgi:hypothetical protein
MTPPGFRLYGPILSRIGECHANGEGLTFRCPFGQRHRNGDANPSGRAKLGAEGQLVIRCFGCGAGLKDFAAFTEFPERAFWPDAWQAGGRLSEPPHGGQRVSAPQRETARYAYRTTTGQLIAHKVRLEPGRDGRAKDFGWEAAVDSLLCQAAGLPETSNGFTRSLTGGNLYPVRAVGERWLFVPHDVKEASHNVPGRCPVIVPKVVPGIYRAEVLSTLAPSKPVFVVEGEKDVDSLVGLGFEAFCPPHGANTWAHEFAGHFEGRSVVVIPDNDQPGLAHAERVIGSLVMHGAAGVKCVRPGHGGYNPPEFGGDVTDWIRANGGKAKAMLHDVLWQTESYSRAKPALRAAA